MALYSPLKFLFQDNVWTFYFITIQQVAKPYWDKLDRNIIRSSSVLTVFKRIHMCSVILYHMKKLLNNTNFAVKHWDTKIPQPKIISATDHKILWYCHLQSSLVIWELTTVGTKGGLKRRSRRSSQGMLRKNACFFTSSASRSLEPSRLSGFLRSNCNNHTASNTVLKISIYYNKTIR